MEGCQLYYADHAPISEFNCSDLIVASQRKHWVYYRGTQDCSCTSRSATYSLKGVQSPLKTQIITFGSWLCIFLLNDTWLFLAHATSWRRGDRALLRDLVVSLHFTDIWSAQMLLEVFYDFLLCSNLLSCLRQEEVLQIWVIVALSGILGLGLSVEMFRSLCWSMPRCPSWVENC